MQACSTRAKKERLADDCSLRIRLHLRFVYPGKELESVGLPKALSLDMRTLNRGLSNGGLSKVRLLPCPTSPRKVKLT